MKFEQAGPRLIQLTAEERAQVARYIETHNAACVGRWVCSAGHEEVVVWPAGKHDPVMQVCPQLCEEAPRLERVETWTVLAGRPSDGDWVAAAGELEPLVTGTTLDNEQDAS